MKTANTAEFFEQLEARIAKYDLLCHPFYKAWAAGELTRDDLREYAQDYYHHVEAFPSYLAALGLRLEDGDLRRAVLANMCDEKGVDERTGDHAVPHSELWLDFAEGMGSTRNLEWHSPVKEIRQLIGHFHNVASEGTPEEALAAFYAYESQVPRVAQEKERPARTVWRRRQVLRLLLPARYRGHLSLARLAQPAGKTNRSASRDRRCSTGRRRECGTRAVAGAGWN
jgi:pyrroloquinoline quinone (PQQ) biosynthesis protein C